MIYSISYHPLILCTVHHCFTVSNDKAIHENGKFRRRKLQKLIPNIYDSSSTDYASHELVNVIYGFSDYNLKESEKSVKSYRKPSVDLISIKTRLQNTMFRSYSAFDKDISPPINLSKAEFESLFDWKMRKTSLFKKQTKVILKSTAIFNPYKTGHFEESFFWKV